MSDEITIEDFFKPGALRDVAVVIDGYFAETIAHIKDEQLAEVMIASAATIMSMLSALETGDSPESILAVVKRASQRARAYSLLEIAADLTNPTTTKRGIVQ